MKEKLSATWLFREHSKTTIRRWADQFRYFYYKRALGGVGYDMRQSLDGDTFIAGIQVVDTEDLKRKLEQLQVKIELAEEKLPDYQRLRAYPELKKPPHFVEILGRQVYIIVRKEQIEFEVIGSKNSYVVTEEDFEFTLKLEQYFDELGWQQEKSKALETRVTCMSNYHYPEVFL